MHVQPDEDRPRGGDPAPHRATTVTSADATVWSMFEARRQEHPDRAAVVDGEVDVDYARLSARAESVAEELARSGVAPGSVVGVCQRRSWELVATLLGVLRAGCAYVPLDPGYPSERIDHMLRHSRAAAVVVDGDLTAASCAEAPVVLCLPELAARAATGAAPVAAADLAYVIYTSGSTGDPKGVSVEHRQVVAMAEAMSELLGQEELRGVLAATSVCFDPSVMEMLGTLMLGGTVVLAEDLLALADLPAAHRVRSTISVPSAMGALLTVEGLPDTVRCVVLGGEVLTRELVERLLSRPSPPRVVNVYGPTEATVFVTATEVSDPDVDPTIGTPVTGTRAYVLDERMSPVPRGVAGELYLAGDQVARGYLHDDERTRERFVAPPRGGRVRERTLYRTGDRVRWTATVTATSALEFLGRVDRQVKLRGYRIELDEVEREVSAVPGVREAAVVVHTAGAGSTLTAHVVAGGDGVSADSVRSHVARRLPRHMVPQVVCLDSALPHLPGGKVDRRRLSNHLCARTEEGVARGVHAGRADGALPEASGRAAAASHLVDTVRHEVSALAGLPGAEAVPLDRPLESFGIDSLDVVELRVRLGQQCGVSLPHTVVVEQDTVAQVVAAIAEVRSSAESGEQPTHGRAPTAPGARLETFQERVRSGHPPAIAAQVAAWSATDRAALVHHLHRALRRDGLDPYGKVVRTGSASHGAVADPGTGEQQDAVIWTTNLYLGLNRDDEVVEEACRAVRRLGTGMGISAAGSGRTDLHLAFEREFAALVGKPSACLFPTGYTASLGAIAGTVTEHDVVVMDQLSHASLVDGARLSGARVRTFRHNDVEDLHRVLEAEASPEHTTLVVLESVYSMGEGPAPVAEIVRAAKAHGALTLVDEAHSFGLYGEGGAGLCAAEGVTDEVDFVVSTLSKALGSIGGVVAAREDRVDLLRTSARAYVFQASTSPADVAAALAALRRLGASDHLRERVRATARHLRRLLGEAGYDVDPGEGLIVAPRVADGPRLRAIARGLYRRGIHTSAVSYPIVERGQGRLRFICSATHSREDVERTVAALVATEREIPATNDGAEDVEDVTGAPVGSSQPGPVTDRARSRLDGWVDELERHLGEVAHTLDAAPPLEVLLDVGADGGPRRVGFDGGRPSEDGPSPQVDVRTCSLRFVDDEAVDALCSDDVARWLEAVVDGSCVLEGDTAPFVWLVGRLADRQRSRDSGEDRFPAPNLLVAARHTGSVGGPGDNGGRAALP